MITLKLDRLLVNFPKYDILLKKSFSVDHSGLKYLLRIPDGRKMSEELTGLAGLTIDSLTEHDGIYYHVDFQSKNQSEMPWRMLGYYHAIVQDYFQNRFHVGESRILQTVVYVGDDEMTMRAEISQDGLHFQFDLLDIREFDGASADLLESDEPHDWIVGVLCKETPDADDWRNVASMIRDDPSCSEWSRREVPALLLIAAMLRKVSISLLKELQDMLQVNVKESPVFKEVFDQGAVFGAAEAYRIVIDSALEEMHLLDESLTSILDSLALDQLASLAKGIHRSIDPLSDIRALSGNLHHPG